MTVVLRASAFVGIRAVADDLSPGPFALSRLLVAATALGVIVALLRHRCDAPEAGPVARGGAVGDLDRLHRRPSVTLPFLPQLLAELPSAPPDAIAWIVYLGIFPTAIAFTTWAFALK